MVFCSADVMVIGREFEGWSEPKTPALTLATTMAPGRLAAALGGGWEKPGVAGLFLGGGDEDFGGTAGGGLLADDDFDVAVECGWEVHEAQKLEIGKWKMGDGRQKRREISLYAGRRIRRSECGRKSRPASFEMTGRVGARNGGVSGFNLRRRCCGERRRRRGRPVWLPEAGK
jgi:hypothetical protein